MGQIEVDRDALRDIARRLQGDLDDLKGTGRGSLQDLQGDGLVSADALGDYPAGREIAQTFHSAYAQIGRHYAELVTSYEGVIDRLMTTINNYENAEDATAATVNQVRPGVGGA